MPQFNKKSLFVSLLVCLPLAANAACNVYQVDTMDVVPSEITAAGATEVASDFEPQNIYPCASGSWVIYIYHDTTLNVYRRVYSCTACPSGYELVRQIIHVGTCSFNSTVEYPITYSCVSTSDVTEGAVRTSLPSGASNLATYGGANCEVSSDVPTLYVRGSNNNYYYLVKQCVACSNSNYRPVLTKYPNSVRGSSLSYVDCQPCGAGTGLKNGSGSDTCSACSAGTYNTGENSFCLSATPGYFVAKANASSQTACATGSYSAALGSVACTACPSGMTNSGTGNSSCASYCSNSDGVHSWVAPVWQTANTVSNLCTPKSCKLGYGWSSESGTCELCGFGKYKSTTGLEACQSCPASEVYINEGQTVQQMVTTPSLGATSRSECQVGTTTFKFYNETGRYFYPDIYACSIEGVADDTAGDDCDSVVPLCLTAGGNTGTIQDSIPSGAIVGGGNCWCRSNNKFFQGPNMSNVDTCNENCPAYCGTALDEGTDAYSEIGCDTDTVSCDSVVSGCRATNGSFSTTYTVKDGELPEWGTTGPYCFCTLNNKVFYATNMNASETCEAACPNYCVNLLTDSDYISQYNLPSQVGCSN